MKSSSTELVRLFLGAAYATAGCIKAFEFHSFLDDIRKFDIVPTSLLVPAGFAIIGAEIILGCSLIVKFRTPLMAFLLGIMTSLFTMGLLVLSWSGQAANCGCFGSFMPERVGAVVITRDILLIAGCFWLAEKYRLENRYDRSIRWRKKK